jgi:hypothetical protein
MALPLASITQTVAKPLDHAGVESVVFESDTGLKAQRHVRANDMPNTAL